MAITHVASAAGATSNPTLTDQVTLSALIEADDVLVVVVHNRYADQDVNLIGVTDNDSGGNAWAEHASSPSANGRLSVWWKVATANTASKMVTATLDTDGAVLMGYSAYRGADTTAPITNLVFEANASGNESHAGFTPDAADSWVFLAVGAMNDVVTANQQTSNSPPGLLSERFDKVSSAAQDHSLSLASAEQAGDPAATGTVLWTMSPNVAADSGVWALKPAAGSAPNEGSGSGSIAWAGSATGAAVYQGAGSGSVAWAGIATGSVVHGGAASGTVIWAGSATGSSPNRGSVTGAVGWAGSADGASALQGSGTGTIDWAGAAVGFAAYQGTTTGTVEWAGAANGAASHAGSATGTVDWAGTASGAVDHEGAATGTIIWEGSADGEAPLIVQSGTAAGTISWAGTASGTADYEGSASGTIIWTGSSTGATDHEGASTGTIDWAGSATGSAAGTGEGEASGTIVWSGAATGIAPYPAPMDLAVAVTASGPEHRASASGANS